MTTIPLCDLKIKSVVDTAVSANETEQDAPNYAKVFSGTAAATTIQKTKKGDIYVKTDTPAIYIAKGTTKASDWVDVSTAT